MVTVTVTVTVTAVNDAPVLTVPGPHSVNEDVVLTITAITVADVDVAPGELLVPLSVTKGTLTLAALGGVTFTSGDGNSDPNMSFTVALNNVNDVLNSITYKGNDNFNGSDTLSVTVDDQGNTGSGDPLSDSDSDSIAITINTVNDAPVATGDTATMAEDSTLTLSAAQGVLANDSDVENDALTASLVSNVSNGTLVLAADGSLSYTPNVNFNGSDSFTYKASDASLDSNVASDASLDSNVATVTITINPVSDTPVGTGDEVTTDEDVGVIIDVLANDLDPDGDSLTVTNLSDPANGTAVLNPDGTVTYTGDQDFNGNDSFTYTPNDGASDGNVVTVTITVNAVNDAPVGTDDDDPTMAENTSLVIDVLLNDSDVEGTSLSVTNLSDPDNGTAVVNPDGTVTYTPDVDFTGEDTFTYTPNDGLLDGNVVTVTVTVG